MSVFILDFIFTQIKNLYIRLWYKGEDLFITFSRKLPRGNYFAIIISNKKNYEYIILLNDQNEIKKKKINAFANYYILEIKIWYRKIIDAKYLYSI